jgi:hypothetical protein
VGKTFFSVDVISVVVGIVVSSSLNVTSGIGAVTTRVDVTFRVTTNAEAVLKFVYTNVAADVVGAIVGCVVVVDVAVWVVVDNVVLDDVVVTVAVEVILTVVVVVVLKFGVLDTLVFVVS